MSLGASLAFRASPDSKGLCPTVYFTILVQGLYAHNTVFTNAMHRS